MLRDYQIDLLNRTRSAYRAGYKHPCIVAPCGTGKSHILAEMARLSTEKGTRVLCLEHRQELCDQLKKLFIAAGVDMSLCRVMMVQTATRQISKLRPPGLIITDENHHAPAQSYKRIYEAFPSTPTVGVTATPCRLGGGGLGDVNDILIETEGVRWFIEHGYLADFEYYAPKLADMTGVKRVRGDFDNKAMIKAMSHPAIYGDAVKHYKDLADGKQAICYCASVELSKRMAQEFCAAGIRAEHLDGTTDKIRRARIIREFREGKVRILCNVDLISEGFDVPDCSCSILLRPTCSLTLYIQQAMRCMRPRSGKRAIIIDHVGNYLRHGLPDEDRTWSLEVKKRAKRKQDEENVTIRQCPECYCAMRSGVKVCPKCGYSFPVQSREIDEVRESELECVKSFVIEYQTADDCRSYKELQEYAKKRGYKPGWAYYQAKNRGYITA